MKKIVKVKNPWVNETKMAGNEGGFISGRGIPKIVILSLGVFTDIYYTEIIVNKILSECGANVYQVYNEKTRSLLFDLSNCDSINRSLLSCNKEEADVVVISVDGTRFQNDADLISRLNYISPDLVFVCVDNSVTNVNKIDRLVGIMCNIGLFIRSPYITYDVGTGVKYPVLCDIYEEEPCVNSTDSNFDLKIKNSILDNLYFPSGTRFL